MSDNPLFKTIEERKHRTLVSREKQIAINVLALLGGRAYVDARLSRFPAESSVQWNGVSSSPGDKNTFAPATSSTNKSGRRQRAYNVNHIARIVGKLNQYVFSKPPERDGIDEDFARDVSLSQIGINRYFRRASAYQVACGWVWLSVDAPEPPLDPETGEPLVMSVAQKRENSDRPYWSIFTPSEVIDWAFASDGSLLWLLSQHSNHRNPDPEQPAQDEAFRVLWQPGRVRRFDYDNATSEKRRIVSVIEATNPPAQVPFVLLGEASPDPVWIDDAESMQRAILDLSSANHESLYKQVYPQMVVPDDLVENTSSALKVETAEAADRIVGGEYPITENEQTKGISRFITPTGADIKIIRDDIKEVKRDLYDFVGMSLKPETRMIASAEAKAWDHLDIEAFLRLHADDLEEAETRLVELTKLVDPSFADYEPNYAKKFDVGNFAEEVAAFIGLANLPAPDVATREAVRSAFRLARTRGLLDVEEDKWGELEAAFDEMSTEDLGYVSQGVEDVLVKE